MALYKAHTKEGAQLRKYYKHSILQLLQFNPKKNNILSYFIKDITDPLELKQYRQIKCILYNKLKQIIIMKGTKKIFTISKEAICNYIMDIYTRKRFNGFLFKYKRSMGILKDLNNKINMIYLDNITLTDIEVIITYFPAPIYREYYNNCDIQIKYIYLKNIRYTKIREYIIDNKEWGYNFCFSFVYYNNKIYLMPKDLTRLRIKILQSIIIIPNKYEISYSFKFNYLA
jgi:hypothetical protein